MVSVVNSSTNHEKFRQELCDLLKKHSVSLSAMEMLAITANLVGKLMAMQVQRSSTLEEVITVVMVNIKSGNKQVVDDLSEHAVALMSEAKHEILALLAENKRRLSELMHLKLWPGGDEMLRAAPVPCNPYPENEGT